MKKRLVPSLHGDGESFADEDLVNALNGEEPPILSGLESSQTPKRKKLNWGGSKKKLSTSPGYNSNNLEVIKSVDYLKD